MSRPAPFLGAVRSQAAMEVRLTARRGENLLAMVGIPVVLLTYFATFGTGPEVPTGMSDIVSGLIPGTLTLAIVASGLVNLGIATAYERGYGVLKRLGGAPLGRSGLVAAKLTVVVAIALVQMVALLAIARFALGWEAGQGISWLGVGVVTIVGSLAFSGLGLLIAGTLRPEAALVVTNALFLAAILLGGVMPIAALTGRLEDMANVLPVGALARAFESALNGTIDSSQSLGLVAGWAVAAFLAAARTFRWE